MEQNLRHKFNQMLAKRCFEAQHSDIFPRNPELQNFACVAFSIDRQSFELDTLSKLDNPLFFNA
jgi:hypothetical protein